MEQLPGRPSAEAGFAGQLQAALGEDVTIVNASVSGDTSADGLARLDWSLAERPDAVLLELDANDMLRDLTVDALRENLTAILQRFKDENIPVLMAGMRGSPALAATTSVTARPFSATCPRNSARHSTPSFSKASPPTPP
ncbi:GDSL-type esterase/lipase family protein [Devosia sp. XJ19-1]|uniref:GDSL-type esterase/lipase family protein n=1 Tax=Devosia ureilytica TaxID=2952754 RepID=A0A9Q4FTX0_9HYPH|nr:GDSL-type esterase/lipase family protein [Devosia ureilytica]MCP8888114.1 GDSL-type esterase/lipase family protein [Devosia ureilytica]